MFWTKIMKETEASPWFDKLQRSLLLLLQLAALLLLMLALARPFWYGSGPAGSQLIVIIDKSATMSAQEKDGTRFELARKEMLRLADETKNQEWILIAAGQPPEILLNGSTDRREIKKLINGLELDYGYEDLNKAFRLAESLKSGKDTAIHIFTDALTEEKLNPSDGAGPVLVHNFGKNKENISLTSFGTSESEGGIKGAASIKNQGNTKQTAILEIRNGSDILYTEKLELGPGEETVAEIPSLPEKTYYTAEVKDDQYAADNQLTSIRTPAAKTVYAAGSVSPFIIKGLETAGYELIQIDEDQLGRSGRGAVAAEGIPLEKLSGKPVLYINHGRSKPVKLSGQINAAKDLLLDYVDFKDVYVNSAYTPLPGNFETIVSDGDSPLIQKGRIGSQPAVVLNFSLADSDWPLQPGFPIFLYNSFQWLSRQTDFLGFFYPGEEKWLNMDKGEDKLQIYSENGENIDSLDLGKQSFTAPEKPGMYQALAGETAYSFSVLLDEREKEPGAHASFTAGAEPDEGKVAAKGMQVMDGMWLWLAFAAFILIAWEGEVYRRGH